MKKNFKLVLALVLSIMMIASMMSALAVDNTLTYDTSVTVTNLDQGDSVKFVQIIKWVDSQGWEWTDAFKTEYATQAKAADNTKTDEAIAADLVSLKNTVTGYIDGSNAFHRGEISAANGAILSKVAAKLTGETVAATLKSGTEYEAVKALAEGATEEQKMAFVGLYCALVTPAKADTLYNPIYVSADFSQESSSPNTQEALLTKSYSNNALAKKETIPLTKEVDVTDNGGDPVEGTKGNYKYDLDVGDDVSFTITSKIPAYSDAYKNPTYILTDTMEEGLVLKSIDSVTVGTTEAPVTWTKDTHYTQDPTTGKGGQTFTITATADGLKAVADTGLAQTITVKYTATITSLENANITEKDNEATVKFSNNPGDDTSYSLLEDRTRNYTFSIDAKLLGQGEYENSELVKIGLSADGTELMQSIQLSNGTWAGVLKDAHFKLTTDSEGNNVYKNKVNGNEVSYGDIVSDANGKLKINGLDAGTYYLVETQAPKGYIKDGRKFTITIEADYETIPAGTYTKVIDGKNVTVNYGSYDVLKSYSVKVNDGTKDITSDFTITNSGETVANQSAVMASSSDNDTKIKNIKGTELPSTGGIGTTIFYVGGSILVLAAAILLITKRRVNSND